MTNHNFAEFKQTLEEFKKWLAENSESMSYRCPNWDHYFKLWEGSFPYHREGFIKAALEISSDEWNDRERAPYLRVFQKFLAENPEVLKKLKDSLIKQAFLTQQELVREKTKSQNLQTQITLLVREKQTHLADLKTNQAWIQELENEVATHLQALDTAQEWHESQKRELTEQRDQVIQEKQQLQNQLQDSQQRILALEADKSDLLNQLTQAQEIYQNYLSQEITQLTQEIHLIKEVIHV